MIGIGLAFLALVVWAPNELWPGKGPLACYGDTLRVRFTFARLRDLEVQQAADATVVTMRINRSGIPWSRVTLIDNKGRGAQHELMVDGRYRFRMPPDVGLMEVGVFSGNQRGWLAVPGPAGNPCLITGAAIIAWVWSV